MAYNLINIGTPNGNNGDTIRDAFKKSNDNDAFLKGKVEEFEGGLPGVISNNGVTVLTPLDGQLSMPGIPSGAIKIQVPSNDSMIKIFFELYNWVTNESFSGIFSGYHISSNGLWYDTSAQIIGSKSDRNFKVRFGHDGVKSCIYIGELTQQWTNLQVAILKIMSGYANTSPENWLTGWDISLETTSFQNISQTHTNNLPVSQ